MKFLGVAATLLLVGCAWTNERSQIASIPPTPTVSPEDVRRELERQRLELEADQICANPQGDRTRELCVERRLRRQWAAEQAERDDRERMIREHEAADRAAEDDYRRRQERAEAIQKAMAPLFYPPAPSPPRSRICTSMVNGNLITTICP